MYHTCYNGDVGVQKWQLFDRCNSMTKKHAMDFTPPLSPHDRKIGNNDVRRKKARCLD